MIHTANFQERLEDELSKGGAEINRILQANGWARATKQELPRLRVKNAKDLNSLALDVAGHAYKRMALKFVELYRNAGFTDEEVWRKRVMEPDMSEQDYASQGVHKPRSFQNVVKAMTAGFTKIVTDTVTEINESLQGSGVKVEDVLGRIEFSRLLKRVVETPMMMPIEPIYVMQQFFRTLNLPGLIGNTVDFPIVALSAIEAHKVGEDGSVPEKTIDLIGGNIVARFMKIGVAARISDDFERFMGQGFDFFGAIVDAARKALAREREWQAFLHLDTHGVNIINNTGRFGFSGAVETGTWGSAGVGLDGQYNGGHTIEDMFHCMSTFVLNGLFPDTMVLSASLWKVWAQDQTMRTFAFQNGIPRLYQTPSGTPGYANEHDVLGGMLGNNPDFPRGSTQTTNMPQFIEGLPLRVVVSPFIATDVDSDIEYSNAMMLDVNAGVGYFIQNQDPTISNWVDMEHDIRKMRIIERYAYGSLKNSTAIRHLRKLKTDVVTFDVRDRLWFTMNTDLSAPPVVGNSKTAT